MKKSIVLTMLVSLFFFIVNAQKPGGSNDKKSTGSKLGIGLKGGLNFANVTKASSINSSSRNGFVVGVFLAPQSHGILAYRTEIAFSRQGYNFKTNTSTGTVDLNYIIMPQLMGINITRFVQLQLGGQMAFLLNAKVDSTGSSSNNPYGKIMDYYNRFDYGAAGGIEIYPFKGLLLGARYNISFGDMYKDMYTNMSNPTPGTTPSFVPKVNPKNNVVQLYLGYRF
jgi:hypothetical protein